MSKSSIDITKLSADQRALLELRLQKKRSMLVHEPVITKRSALTQIPLSFAQQRLWFLHQLEPDNPFYNSYAATRLTGALDLNVVTQTLNAIRQRHDILRTIFPAVDGEPRQVVVPYQPMIPEIVDLTMVPATEREQHMHELIVTKIHALFDLSQGPLFRCTLLKLATQAHVILLAMHHIITDGWSLRVLIHEFAALYASFVNGQPSTLPALPIQYADFSVWQREWLQGEVLEQQLAYWKRQLTDVPATLDLLTDRPRGAVRTYQGKHHYITLPASLLEELEQLSRQEKCTLFMTMLAAFKVLLYRYTHQEDLLVGCPIANRNRSEVEPLLGFFVNTLVLRTKLTGEQSFRTVLQHVREATLDAYTHQDLPFEKLIEELAPERHLSQNPLFQVAFSLLNVPMPTVSLPGLSAERLELEIATEQFDLSLELYESAQGLYGWLRYSTDLFDETTIVNMAGHLQVLLKGIVNQPDQPIQFLPLLTETARQKIIAWNTSAPAPTTPRQYVHALIAAQAAQTPRATAVVSENQQYTYQQLNEQANQIAHYLQSLQLGPEARIGVCMDRSLRQIAALLGILKAGAAYVPLDPAYPLERLNFMVEDAHIVLLLTQQDMLARLSVQQIPVICLDADTNARLAHQPTTNPLSDIQAEQIAYIIYTSGSTGRPKGVQITHGGLLNYVLTAQRAFALTAQDRVLQFASISFDTAAEEIFPCLAQGATLVLRTDVMLESPATFLHTCQAWGISVLDLPTSYWHQMLATLVDAELPTAFVEPLRLVIVGGEKALPEHVAHWQQYVDPRVHLLNTYGPTEGTIVSTMFDLTTYQSSGQEIPIGWPIERVQTYILDQHMQPVPVGVAGELYLGGQDLARGYLNLPDLTAEKFLPHPFSSEPGARLYRTGDLVRYRADRSITFLGRLDKQVKLRGFRIELDEIQATLKQHPVIQDAIVALPETAIGEDPSLAAYVLLNTHYQEDLEQHLEAEQVREWQIVHDQELFNQASANQEATFNIGGWVSSYTGQPIAEQEMREWVDHTVERIMDLHPTRVLEIGCGTGLLLFRVAPHCTAYWGTDFSEVALHYVQRVAKETLPQVHLLHRQATDFTDLAPVSFDTVIINSVVQYFPNSDYLLRVLAGAVDLVKDGGTIFIGDVRNLLLLETFHAAILLHKAPPSLSVSQFRQRLQKALQQDPELVIDPAFFGALQRQIPRITHVEIQPKRGQASNELTKFRYDVTLSVGPTARSTEETPWLDWQAQALTLAEVRRILQQQRPAVLGICHIPHERIEQDRQFLQLLKNADVQQSISELREALHGASTFGSQPEALWQLAEEYSYTVRVSYAASEFVDCLDVIFSQQPAPSATFKLTLETQKHEQPWHTYTNIPLYALFTSKLVPDILSFLRQKLPAYMVPTTFMRLEQFPRLPNGKIDWRALPAPDLAQIEKAAAFVAPHTSTEELLASLWIEVLGVKQVGRFDDFFFLGGHSLLATQIISRVRSLFRVELPLRALFEAPTLGGLAARIESARQDKQGLYTPILPAPRDEDPPLSFAQERIWFLDMLAQGAPDYHVPGATRLVGPLNLVALQRSVWEIMQRHEILRTTFLSVQGRPVQHIAPFTPEPFSHIDLLHLPEAQRESYAMTLASEEAIRPFDLARGPLLRVSLLRLAEEEHILLLSMHHIIADGWSAGIFASELLTLYEAFRRDKPSPLPVLPIQYADFTIWQRHWLQGEVLTTQLAYWKRQFAQLPPILRLPIDRPRPAIQTTHGADLPVFFPADLSGGLKALGQKAGTTLFMTLLTAFITLLFRYTGQDDITIGTLVAGRNRAETEGMLGCFMNALALRTHIPPSADFLALLAQVRSVTLDAYEYQDLPFEKLIAELQPARRRGYTPLFQVLFLFQNTPMPTLEASDLALHPVAIATGTAPFEMTFNLAEVTDGLRGFLRYNTDLFDASTIERMMRHFLLLLRGIVDNPAQSLLEFSVLTEEEHLVGYTLPRVELPADLPEPATTVDVPQHGVVAPRTLAEETIAEIWMQLLDLPEVSIYDDFFTLGGHSLLVTQLIFRLSETFQIEIPLSRLFAATTIVEQALEIEEALLAEIENIHDEEALLLLGEEV